MFMNTKSTGYGEDTGWKARYRLSTLNFGHHKRSLNTNTRSPIVTSLLYVVPEADATQLVAAPTEAKWKLEIQYYINVGQLLLKNSGVTLLLLLVK